MNARAQTPTRTDVAGLSCTDLKRGKKVGAKLAQEGGTPLKTTGCVEVSAGGLSAENKMFCAPKRENPL